MSRLKPGDRLNRLTWQNLQGQPVHLPDVATPLVHLQFRRFAGCPICNLHLRQMAARIDELRQAGVHEIAFFHSSAAAMQPYQGDLPFNCIADPEMTVYRQFGVEVSWRGLLDPRNLPAVFNGMVGRFPKHLFAGGEAGHAGMPADFLIDARGVIIDAHYGRFADDQWTVDEVLERAHRRLDRAA